MPVRWPATGLSARSTLLRKASAMWVLNPWPRLRVGLERGLGSTLLTGTCINVQRAPLGSPEQCQLLPQSCVWKGELA